MQKGNQTNKLIIIPRIHGQYIPPSLICKKLLLLKSIASIYKGRCNRWCKKVKPGKPLSPKIEN